MKKTSVSHAMLLALIEVFGAFSKTSDDAKYAIRLALGAVIATWLTFFLRVDDGFWTAISVLSVLSPTKQTSFERAWQRIVATFIGALLGVIVCALFNTHLFIVVLIIIGCTMIATYQGCYTASPYIWLIGIVTFLMVVLNVFSTPTLIIPTAYYRWLAVLVGTGVAVIMAIVWDITPTAKPTLTTTSPISPPHHRIAFRYAIKMTVTVLSVPFIWVSLALPGLSQIAVSVIVLLQMDEANTYQKGLQRFFGCLLGTLVALALLGLNMTSLTIFLSLEFLTVIFLAYLHHKNWAHNYIGTQACMAFFVGYVDYFAPTTDLSPALERLSGVILGFIASLVIGRLLFPNLSLSTQAEQTQ